jgi:hypothetical protein
MPSVSALDSLLPIAGDQSIGSQQGHGYSLFEPRSPKNKSILEPLRLRRTLTPRRAERLESDPGLSEVPESVGEIFGVSETTALAWVQRWKRPRRVSFFGEVIFLV